MIICVIGGIGSGKTVTIIKEIIRNKYYPLTNFNIKHKEYHRLRFNDLITEHEGKQKVNWDFWDDTRNRHKNFCIFLDEANNLVGSRTSLSKKNILLSQWISQIRKILHDSPNNHIYIITQLPRMIDVNFRELCQVVIHCKKLIIGEKTIILNDFYNGFKNFEIGNKITRTWFKADTFFRYYDTYQLIRFKDAEEFI